MTKSEQYEDHLPMRAMEVEHSFVDKDELTGLFRFQPFLKECARLEVFEQSTGFVLVLFIDADNLKLINDSLGHCVGDDLIAEIATSISTCLPKGAIACRKGGDEFLAVVKCDNRIQATKISQSVSTSLSGLRNISGHEIMLSCSIGASIEPSEISNLDQQSKNADIAMYWAKRDGKDQLRIYDEESCADFVMMHELSFQFPEALAKGELSVAYQPIYGIETRRIEGAEALVRWNHPQYGAISAGSIVKLATKSGKTSDLGKFVIEKACQTALHWPDDKYVCVNFSAADFLKRDFAKSIASILTQIGTSPKQFRIEITESEVLELNQTVLSNLESLRRMGIKVGVDDFGTGYSSMGNIDGFPADFVKIDRSLIAGCDYRISSKIFIKAIRSVADKIGFELIAEGIETMEEAVVVRGAGISLAQGFYFCPPLEKSEINKVMFRFEGDNCLRTSVSA